MAVRVAYMGQVTVDQDGNVLDKNAASTSMRAVLRSSTDWRILPKSDNPSTGTNANTWYPTLTEYLEREELAGYRLHVMSPSILVTYL